MNKKTITKRIALFMAMLIGLECLPVEALAVENQVNASTYTPTLDINEEETPIEVVGELEDQRSAYTKSFRLSDGTVSVKSLLLHFLIYPLLNMNPTFTTKMKMANGNRLIIV